MSTHDVTDLRFTIVPKSDQLNAEQLLGGPITIAITDVALSSSIEQPTVIHYEGDDGRPFKPCKTMRKILIFAWGENGKQWIGRSLKLFNDPEVRFGHQTMGGVRISHMSHIKGTLKANLTTTKGKKALYVVEPLHAPPPAPDFDHAAAIKTAETQETLKKAFAAAYRAGTPAQKDAYKAAYDARLMQLMNPQHQQPEPPPADDGQGVDKAFVDDMDAAGVQA